MLDQPEQALGDRGPVGARVEPGGEVAERKVELGCEDEDCQRGLKGDAALDEPDADRDGDERNAERGCELEHGSRQEREAQRPHRRRAVLVACPLDPLDLRLAAIERPQRRQAANDIEEVGCESDIACQRSRALRPVARPINQKNTGTSGRVSSISPAERRSSEATTTSTVTGTTAARTS